METNRKKEEKQLLKPRFSLSLCNYFLFTLRGREFHVYLLDVLYRNTCAFKRNPVGQKPYTELGVSEKGL